MKKLKPPEQKNNTSPHISKYAFHTEKQVIYMSLKDSETKFGSAENTEPSQEHVGKEHFFQPTVNGWTICAYVFLVALFFIACVLLGMNIRIIPKLLLGLLSVVSPLLYGFVISFVLSPVVRFFENKVFSKWRNKRQGLKHILCIIIVYVLVIALITFGVLFLIPQITSSYNDFSSQLSLNIVNIRNGIANVFDLFLGSDSSSSFIYYDVNPDFRKDVTDFVIADTLNTPLGTVLKTKNTATQDEVQALLNKIGKSITSAFNNAIPSIFKSAINLLLEAKNVLLGVIISIYFLISKNSIIRTFDRIAHAWMPAKAYRKFAWLVNKAKNIFRDYIIVRMLDSLIVGTITLIGLLIVGNKYAFLIAIVIGVSALIPFIGPVIGITFCAVMMMLLGFKYALGFAIVMVIVQLLDDRIFEPILNRGHSQHKLAGIWLFSAVVIMSGLFGVLGLLFGIPIFAFIYAIVKDWAEKRLRRTGQSIETDAYYFSSREPIEEPQKEEDTPSPTEA